MFDLSCFSTLDWIGRVPAGSGRARPRSHGKKAEGSVRGTPARVGAEGDDRGFAYLGSLAPSVGVLHRLSRTSAGSARARDNPGGKCESVEVSGDYVQGAAF